MEGKKTGNVDGCSGEQADCSSFLNKFSRLNLTCGNIRELKDGWNQEEREGEKEEIVVCFLTSNAEAPYKVTDKEQAKFKQKKKTKHKNGTTWRGV